MYKGILYMGIRMFFTVVGLFTALLIPQFADAAKINHITLGASTGAAADSVVIPGTEGMDEREIIATLRHDIQLLDQEIAQCERKRKGWVAATVVGGIGVVSTGIAAIVQGSKLHDNKQELDQVKTQVADIESKK